LNSNEENIEKCEFTVPYNFKVAIKEIRPFYVYSNKFILLDLKIINPCHMINVIKIESKPVYGQIIFLNSSALIYKPTRNFSGYDLFQLEVEDEFGECRIESVLIRIICK
jgi:hypothetical protein